MSLGIAISTTEGLVLAADSRQSYRNLKGVGRIGSDSAQKVFALTDNVGLVVAGLAFLNNDGVPKNVSRYIADFKRIHELKKLTVKQIADKLYDDFSKHLKHKEMLADLSSKIKADMERQGLELIERHVKDATVRFKFRDKHGNINEGRAVIEGLHFLVAGFNNDGTHMVCNVTVPGGVRVTRDSAVKGREYGADWIGQTDVISRIILGFDGRIVALPMVAKAISTTSEQAVKDQLSSLEYVVQWGTMTLQDAVDFGRLAIETTSSIQRFSDGIAGDPGDMPGVGGDVDIAAIRPDVTTDDMPDSKFTWLHRKQLKTDS